ncbi:MAG: GNAT family N-acetyltransferase [Halobacteriovoraceae bacterium]|nr:GNAT family N-acetyltransferase [Halobacteriovoraceae bacterium]
MSLERVEVNDAVLKALADAKLDSYDFELDRNVSLPFVTEELESGFNDLNSDDVKKARHEFFQIPKAKEEDYGEFIFKTADGIYLMAGIRHFGGNKEYPFIHLVSSKKDPSLDDRKIWAKELKNFFEVFEPLHLSFGSPKKTNVDFIGSVTMATKAENYKNLPKWENENALEIHQESNIQIFDWYVDGYRNFHKHFPDLKVKVPVLERDILEDSLREGLLYSARKDGELVGLIAAQSGQFLGMDGLYFNEIFLLEKMKGQGFGKVLQKKLVLEVTKGHEIIWGTIDEFNIPSYKTAEANGRKPIHYECFLKI